MNRGGNWELGGGAFRTGTGGVVGGDAEGGAFAAGFGLGGIPGLDCTGGTDTGIRGAAGEVGVGVRCIPRSNVLARSRTLLGVRGGDSWLMNSSLE